MYILIMACMINIGGTQASRNKYFAKQTINVRL